MPLRATYLIDQPKPLLKRTGDFFHIESETGQCLHVFVPAVYRVIREKTVFSPDLANAQLVLTVIAGDKRDTVTSWSISKTRRISIEIREAIREVYVRYADHMFPNFHMDTSIHRSFLAPAPAPAS